MNVDYDNIVVTTLLDIHCNKSKCVGHDNINKQSACKFHGNIDCVSCRGGASAPTTAHFDNDSTLTQVSKGDNIKAHKACQKHGYIDCAVCEGARAPDPTHIDNENTQNLTEDDDVY